MLLANNWDIDDRVVRNLIVWNNGPWDKFGELTVYTSQLMLDMEFTDSISDEQIHCGLTRASLTTIFAALPPEPILARWTKAFQSLSWFNPAVACNGIVIICFSLSFDASACDQLLAAAAQRMEAALRTDKLHATACRQ